MFPVGAIVAALFAARRSSPAMKPSRALVLGSKYVVQWQGEEKHMTWSLALVLIMPLALVA
ncbi:MAG TPA: hypothetical protein VFQ61_10720, partial [Polyangiaceae bacterium]|nr:hypothetical protein [Polyangiaceae bacterium]